MKIAVLKELADGEARVSATPETVKKFAKLGASITVEKGAGESASISDAEFEEAGATVAERSGTIKDADIILAIQGPDPKSLKGIKKGAWIAASLNPFGERDRVDAYAKLGVEALAMEFMPRITRAQSMDILSSQSNLSGSKAVVLAGAEYGRAFPMMMTAAGTVNAAKCFVMGVGVAGLQAIATARRLGAQVSATDVRPETAEQIESLGAKPIFDDDLASDGEYLFKNLGVEYGRTFGGPAPFRKSKTELQSVSEAEGRSKWSNANIKKSPLFKEFGTADFVITDHPRDAFQYSFKDYDKIAAYNVAFLKNAYPITPKYYEVMNEPFVHAKDYVETWAETPAVIVEMSKVFKAVADKVHAEIPGMQVGGYASAYPEVEKDNFDYWNTRMKTFMDVAGESMRFFATHIYDGRNVQGDFTLRSGSNSEAILDLIEAYSYKKWKVVKPHLISEYGFTAQGLVGNVSRLDEAMSAYFLSFRLGNHRA